MHEPHRQKVFREAYVPQAEIGDFPTCEELAQICLPRPPVVEWNLNPSLPLNPPGAFSRGDSFAALALFLAEVAPAGKQIRLA
jgi:hypothetical protein